MKTEEMISLDEFSFHYNIEVEFIQSLHESGLIEIIVVEKKTVIPVSQLQNLEKLARLHYEMNINLEGIETITYLLQRMNEMQQHILLLNNKLSMYENS
jgi:chaperone modulatory protein CbpM